MATNIEVNELKINKMSEATLSEMESAGNIEPNQIFMTDDDVYNDDVVERVETVYAMDGGSKLDWNQSGGLYGGFTFTDVDFSKYKRIRVTLSPYLNNEYNSGGNSAIIEMAVSGITMTNGYYIATNDFAYAINWNDFADASFKVALWYHPYDKTFRASFGYVYQGGVTNFNNNESCYISKIEGVY